MNNVFVYVELENGAVADVSLELLTKGRELADRLGVKLEAVAMGENIAGIEKELAKYGADTVWVADDKIFSPFRTLPHTSALCGLIEAEKPQIVLFGATPVGRDFAPRVSSALHSGLTADCTQLEIGDHKDAKTGKEYKDLLYQIRPAFGGNVMATIICPNYRPQMATVRPGVMEMPQRDMSRQGKVTVVDAGLSMDDRNVEILQVVHDDKKSVDITEAKVLVSGGRGVGSAEGYAPLRELAEVLGGEVSSSRIGVDSGWIEKDRQVGQTGKTVHPDLYVACGISGAIQHLAGMEGSEFVIAINKDETCPMMKLADLGIVGDLHVIVPKLTEAIKAYKAAQKVD